MDNQNNTSNENREILARRIHLAPRSDSAILAPSSSSFFSKINNFVYIPVVESGDRSIFFYMFKTLFLKYFSIKGRASRKEFWALALFTFCLKMLCFYSFYIYSENFELLYASWEWITSLTVIPSITVIIRRLHDFGKSGWWVFVPTYKVLLFAFIKADKGPNAFGNPE